MPAERANRLKRIADIMDANTEHLAMVEILDNGKPIRETMAIDIPYSVNPFRYSAARRRRPGQYAGQQRAVPHLARTHRRGRPDSSLELPPAHGRLEAGPGAGLRLLHGFKPSICTSLSMLELVRLIQNESPKGVFNLVTGKGSRQGSMCLHALGSPNSLLPAQQRWQQRGRGGGVCTKDINRAIRESRAVTTGRMWVNTYNGILAGAPFGGYKIPGIGSETHKTLRIAWTFV